LLTRLTRKELIETKRQDRDYITAVHRVKMFLSQQCAKNLEVDPNIVFLLIHTLL